MTATDLKTSGVVVAVLTLVLGGVQQVAAQCGSCSSHAVHDRDSDSGTHDHGSAGFADYIGRSSSDLSKPMAPVHGGQVTTDKYGSYEVLYLPQETRVYLLDTYGMPVSARGVRGQVTMQMREDGRTSSFPLIYVESENAGIREDFLGAPIDVTRVRDGDMTVTVELTNLPFAPTQRDARFVQTFVLSRPPATVQIVTLTEADRPAVERQEVCPVLGTRLGEMGTPIKLVVNGKPLYLCCKGCIAKVQVNPTKYLAAAPQPQRAPDTTTPPPSPAHAHH